MWRCRHLRRMKSRENRIDREYPMCRCDGVNRREFLRVGSLSVLGLALADAFRLGASKRPQRPACRTAS